MGMISEGMVSKLKKQAEKVLKPEDAARVVVIKRNYSASEAKAAKQEFLNPEKIARMARDFIARKINLYIEERAKEGYDYALVSIKEYPTTPINEAVFQQVIVFLEEQGFSAKISAGASPYAYVRNIYISWKEEE